MAVSTGESALSITKFAQTPGKYRAFARSPDIARITCTCAPCCAIATCTVVVPIVVTILFPRRMESRLLWMKSWIAAHSTAVGATISILIGGFVIGVGVSG